VIGVWLVWLLLEFEVKPAVVKLYVKSTATKQIEEPNRKPSKPKQILLMEVMPNKREKKLTNLNN